jgi:hypothetical protein
MIKSYKAHSLWAGIKFSCADMIRQNKWKIFLSFVLILASICLGVTLAIKNNNSYNLGMLQEIDISSFTNGFVASSSAFASRSISLVVNVAILTALSFSPFMFPLAQVFFCFRGYLFGLNLTLIFIFYGIGSIVTAVVVVLPLQLLTLFTLVLYFHTLSKINFDRKKYGSIWCNRGVVVLCGTLALLMLNLVETVLLLILNGNVILVI